LAYLSWKQVRPVGALSYPCLHVPTLPSLLHFLSSVSCHIFLLLRFLIWTSKYAIYSTFRDDLASCISQRRLDHPLHTFGALYIKFRPTSLSGVSSKIIRKGETLREVEQGPVGAYPPSTFCFSIYMAHTIFNCFGIFGPSFHIGFLSSTCFTFCTLRRE